MDYADTILQQLGGRRFIAMTGTKNFVKNSKKSTISMKLTRNKIKAQYLTITLTGADDYTMEFSKFNRNLDKTVCALYEGIYADQLERTFTEATGLYTSL